MAVGRSALTLELYGADIVGEYVRRYNVNVRSRVLSTSVHMIVGIGYCLTSRWSLGVNRGTPAAFFVAN